MVAKDTEEAKVSAGPASTIAGPRRISIVGCSGSGKTRLAKQLAFHLSMPLYQLDHLRRPDGCALPQDEFRQRVDSLSQRETWVIDGHYRDVRHMIWQRADAVIWLNYPLPIVAFRLFMRFSRTQILNVVEQRLQRSEQTVQSNPPASFASWRQRLNRFCRSLPERREYRMLLTSERYAHVALFEMTSARGTANWLSSLVRNGDLGLGWTRPQEPWRRT